MRHLDDGAVAATVGSMAGCRCLSIRQLSVLLPEPWQSPQELIRPCWLFTVSLPPAALYIYTWYAIASSITCLDILLNGLYLYLWLYVESCFTPCKYQSIKYYYKLCLLNVWVFSVLCTILMFPNAWWKKLFNFILKSVISQRSGGHTVYKHS